jgi:PAS domain S-box-containing protein
MVDFHSISDSKNVFFRCVEDCNEAIMISNTMGNILYVNPAWSRIYGYGKDEAIGKTPKLLHSGFHDSKFYRKMWQAILDPQLGHWKGEIINKSRDGKLIPVFLTITPIRDHEAMIVGYMGIAMDMSAQKQLEAKVLQQDRLASIGILASGLAHEVGTPLGVIRGRAEFLMMQPLTEKSEVLKGGLKTIVTQIDRISKLISSLLRFSRATDDVRNQDVEVISVINEVLDLVGQNLKSNAIELKLDIPQGTSVYADFNRLQQIFLNLIVNSVQAIQKAKKDGAQRSHSITIHAEKETDANGGRCRVSVVDTGCGIPAENLRKLFQPFFTTKDIGEGTGLGLAIVSKLTHEMNGEVAVESVFGEGATFSVLLPSSV